MWTTRGLVPLSAPGKGSAVQGWTDDLAETVVDSAEPLGPGGTPEAVNYYVRNNVTGEYRLLFASPIGESGGFRLAGATPSGGRILFEDTAQLLPAAVKGVSNLYEWDEGAISLVGILPDGSAPTEGVAAGPGRCEQVLNELTCFGQGGAAGDFYTQNTISQDGSRIFFTDEGTGQIYVRESEAGKTIPVSEGLANWRAATPDGSKAFYIEGKNLYRFNFKRYEESNKPESKALAEAREPLTTGAGGVSGTLGISNDGSYIYFLATGVLAGENSEGHMPVEGAANLYEWHEGNVTFIAGLDSSEDISSWTGRCLCNGSQPAEGEKSAQVSSSGTTLLFASEDNLTDYEHPGLYELYIYEAQDASVACVSCNESGASASKSAFLIEDPQVASAQIPNVSLTRNLSEDGSRVFFETEEALLPQDINQKMNVYEWEREGAASCPGGSGDCLYSISTGASTSGSYFGDASADGNDVFFFTRQSLVAQDEDFNQDLYDARVGGGIAAQNAPPRVPCVGEVCHGVPAPAPSVGAPSSASFSGSGNLTPALMSPVSTPATKSLTRAQKLAKALKECRKNPKKKRVACEKQARKQYAPAKKRRKL